jgi:hypothetical protein
MEKMVSSSCPVKGGLEIMSIRLQKGQALLETTGGKQQPWKAPLVRMIFIGVWRMPILTHQIFCGRHSNQTQFLSSLVSMIA